jgi:hypothetical protein
MARKRSDRRLALGAALAAAALLTTACTDEQRYEYLAHTDMVTQGAGDAVAANTAAQTVNPWPAHSQNKNIDLDGKRGYIAVRRYETNTSIKPKGLNTEASIDLGNGNGTAVKN